MILVPVYSTSKGVTKKTFSDTGDIVFCNFKTFGGTESVKNDVLTIVDTANIETWFNPIIKSDCRIKLLDTGKIYDIISEVENIDMRNQFIKFKVRAVSACA